MERCEFCKTGSGRYDWGLACCLARYVAGEPTQARRAMWLERIRRAVPAETLALVEPLARELYAQMPGKLPQERSKKILRNPGLGTGKSLSGRILPHAK